MTRLYHGTSYQALTEIARTGILGRGKHPSEYQPSEHNTIYFWSEDNLRGRFAGRLSEPELRNALLTFALHMAVYSVLPIKDRRRAVLVFDSSDVEKLGSLERDDSFPNTAGDAVQFKGTLPFALAREVLVEQKEHPDFEKYVISGLNLAWILVRFPVNLQIENLLMTSHLALTQQFESPAYLRPWTANA
jgi:hypothetical protein